MQCTQDSATPLIKQGSDAALPIHQQLQYLRSLEGFDSKRRRRLSTDSVQSNQSNGSTGAINKTSRFARK